MPLAAIAPQISAPLLTREARLYAVREIARRAGVSNELCNSWRIAIDNRSTTIHLDSYSDKKIIFPAPLAASNTSPRDQLSTTTRAAWAYPPPMGLRELTPHFVVPFIESSNENGTVPVFAFKEPDTIQFNFDLPTAAFWTLSRVEETITEERDVHGRFPASAGIAAKGSFLHRPIVDEYGFAFEQALRCLLPRWSPQRKRFRVKLSHDIDEVGIPFSLRSAIGHTLRRRSPLATIQDLVSSLTAHSPAYLMSVYQIAQLSRQHNLNSAFYWKASPASKYDSGYDPRHSKLKGTMSWLKDEGFENGVHPGYDTFGSKRRLQSEVAILRQCLGNDKLGGRQHFLRWQPDTWRHWEACGLAYDSTVGFADHIGFRAGTCIPYRPWFFSENREANLIEIPLLVMDRTLAYYMKLETKKSLEVILECIARCRSVGGVFTMVWHNDAILDPVYGDLYSQLLRHLSGSPELDWKEEC